MFVQEEPIEYSHHGLLGISFLSIRHYPPRYHPEVIEFLLPIRGRITVVSGFESARLKEGDFFTVDQGDIHYIYSDDPDSIVLSVHLNLRPLMLNIEELKYTLFVFENYTGREINRDLKKRVLDLLMAAGYLYAVKGNRSSAVSRDIAGALIDIMKGHFSLLNYLTGYTAISEHKSEVMKQIVIYIADNYRNNISLSTLADYLHYDKSYLARFMKDLIHFNFSTILNYFRCAEAEFLLLTTSLSNDEISYRCGFPDLRLFYENFKKWWKTTPYRHRKKYSAYLGEPEEYKRLEPREVSEIIRNAYSEYHLKNELARLSSDNSGGY